MTVIIQFEKEDTGVFEGVNLVIFILFCATLGIMLISICVLVLKKTNKKKI